VKCICLLDTKIASAKTFERQRNANVQKPSVRQGEKNKCICLVGNACVGRRLRNVQHPIYRTKGKMYMKKVFSSKDSSFNLLKSMSRIMDTWSEMISSYRNSLGTVHQGIVLRK